MAYSPHYLYNVIFPDHTENVLFMDLWALVTPSEETLFSRNDILHFEHSGLGQGILDLAEPFLYLRNVTEVTTELLSGGEGMSIQIGQQMPLVIKFDEEEVLPANRPMTLSQAPLNRPEYARHPQPTLEKPISPVGPTSIKVQDWNPEVEIRIMLRCLKVHIFLPSKLRICREDSSF